MMFFGDYMHLLRATGRWRKFQELYPIVKKALATRNEEALQHFRLSGIYWGFPMDLLYELSVKAMLSTREFVFRLFFLKFLSGVLWGCYFT
jgi:hypothetical protein